jgi:hypothetical protein
LNIALLHRYPLSPCGNFFPARFYSELPGECLGLSGINGLDTRLSHAVETERKTFKSLSIVGYDLQCGGPTVSLSPSSASFNVIPLPVEIGLEKALRKDSSTKLREDRLPEAGQGVLDHSAFDCTTGRIMSNSLNLFCLISSKMGLNLIHLI